MYLKYYFRSNIVLKLFRNCLNLVCGVPAISLINNSKIYGLSKLKLIRFAGERIKN